MLDGHQQVMRAPVWLVYVNYYLITNPRMGLVVWWLGVMTAFVPGFGAILTIAERFLLLYKLAAKNEHIKAYVPMDIATIYIYHHQRCWGMCIHSRVSTSQSVC